MRLTKGGSLRSNRAVVLDIYEGSKLPKPTAGKQRAGILWPQPVTGGRSRTSAMGQGRDISASVVFRGFVHFADLFLAGMCMIHAATR